MVGRSSSAAEWLWCVSRGLSGWAEGQKKEKQQGWNQNYPLLWVVQPCDCILFLSLKFSFCTRLLAESQYRHCKGGMQVQSKLSRIWKSLGPVFYLTWYTWERFKKMWESTPMFLAFAGTQTLLTKEARDSNCYRTQVCNMPGPATLNESIKGHIKVESKNEIYPICLRSPSATI